MPQAISAGHQTTLDTAKEILRSGGNAFDAAVAAHLAMFVAEPCMASAGGGGFALTFQPGKGIRFLDFFCQTPLHKPAKDNIDFFPIEVDFGKDTEQFFVGAASVATPGTIAGLFYLQEHFGTMPFSELAAIPMQLARDGVAVDKFQAIDFGLLKPILGLNESGRAIFYKDKSIKREGDVLCLPAMADFLDFISAEGVDGFYKGEVGKQISLSQKERGGFLTRSDFEQYKVNVSAPLQFDFNNKTVHTANQPSLGGVILSNYLHSSSINGKENTIQRLNEKILDIQYQIGEYDRNNGSHLLSTWKGNVSTKGTSHFNILDKWGNAIALTTSIGEGNGAFIKDTQMQLNNMLGELFLLPAGAHSWLENQRLNSMMTPTIILDEDESLNLILGSGGASRIPFAIGQTLQGLFERGLNLEEAIKNPRIHFHDLKLQAEFESALSVKNMGTKIWNQRHMFFGGVHAISKQEDKVGAFADPRRFGVAEIF